MTYDMRKSGIPVLAYPPCDAASPVPLFLVFRFNESRATATLLLRSSLFVDSFDDAQTFILQYDADNLKPGAISLGPATIPLPQERLAEVSREGNPQIRTLSLTLLKVCPVWCQPSFGILKPKPNHEVAFNQFANLTKATQLHILFDYNWLHRDHHAIFHRLIDRPQQLTGFPVWRHYSKQYRRGDCSVFDIEGAEHVDTDATTEEERTPPPMYTEGSKRPRHASTATPSSPPAKRVLLSPYSGDVHTSPTEKGSVVTPSPKPLRSSATPSPKFPPLAALNPSPPPFSAGPDLQLAVERAVESLLPNMLGNLLPSLLPRLLSASSPTGSQHSIASQISTAPPPAALSALGISLGDHMASRIEDELENLYAHTLSHANYLRNTADAEFFDERELERLAFDRVAETKFEEFKEQCEDFGEAELERVGWKIDELGDKLAAQVDRLKEERLSLEQWKEELRRDKEELRRDREDLRRDKRELRKDKKNLRKQKRELQREREVVQSRCSNIIRDHDARGKRAESAPV